MKTGKPTNFVFICFVLALVFSCGVANAQAVSNKAGHAHPAALLSDSKKESCKTKPLKSGKGACLPIVVEGEVVDAWCWSSGVMGAGRGPEHYSCGLKCIMGGVSCGIVDDEDRLYIAAKSKAYKGCAELLAPYLAHRVKIKCWIAERGGCRLLGKISEVKDLGPAVKLNGH